MYKDDIQVTVTYLSHEADLVLVKKALQSIINPALQMLILGDFNFDAREMNVVASFLKEKLGLKQMVNIPTHKDGRSIDHVYASSLLESQIELTIMFKYFTDHAALQIKFQL